MQKPFTAEGARVVGGNDVRDGMSRRVRRDSAERESGMSGITATQLGSRLRTARECCGLSQSAVARMLDLPRTAVTNMENGSRRVSTLELAKLMDYLGVSAEYFLRATDAPGADELVAVLHRQLPEINPEPGIAYGIRQEIELFRTGAHLRRILNRQLASAIPEYREDARSTGEAVRQGEAVAQKERQRLALGNLPIQGVEKFLGDQGILTAAIKLPASLSGLFMNHPEVGMAIMVNRKHADSRRRFSYLHEYAHALFDRRETVLATRKENSDTFEEKRANSFAAAFLAPPGGVREQLEHLGKAGRGRQTQIIVDVANDSPMNAEVQAAREGQAITYRDVATVAHHFGVSFDAMVWRLQNLEFIRPGARTDLIGQGKVGQRYMSFLDTGRHPRNGAAGADQHDAPHFHKQLMHLAIEAYCRGEISRGRLVEIVRKLGIDGDEALGLAGGAVSA